MRPVFVLVHSLYVGPLTCGPVADALAVRQDDSVIPSLLDVADADPPLLSPGGGCGQRGDEPPRSRPMRAARGAQQLGPVVPLLVRHTVRPVRCCLFVDAALPARAAQTPVRPTELLDFLRGKVLPWTEWWEEDVSPLFPDAATRAAVTAEEPRLPFAYG
jgi:hypothetical protein